MSKRDTFSEQILASLAIPPEQITTGRAETATEASMMNWDRPITRKALKRAIRVFNRYAASAWNPFSWGLTISPLTSASADIWYLRSECDLFPWPSLRYHLKCRLRQVWAICRFQWYSWQYECGDDKI